MQKKVKWFVLLGFIIGSGFWYGYGDSVSGEPLPAEEAGVRAGLQGVADGTIDATVYGAEAGGILGADLIAEDLNNDGIADMILNAPWADCIGGRSGAGAVFVVFGKSNWPAETDLRDQADVKICGAYNDDLLGAGDRHEAGTLAVGDVNGDGFNDLVIGAGNADGPRDNRPNAGNVYILLGQQQWPVLIDLAQSFNGVVLYGESMSDFFGTAVAVGNLDNDAYADVVIGAMNADVAGRSKIGKAYVWYGRPSFPQTIDLAQSAADFTVLGRDNLENLGVHVQVADLDGTGAEDLIVGARFANNQGRNRNGAIYGIFSNGSRATGVLDLRNSNADWLAYGGGDFENVGERFAIGDVNGDGQPDLVATSINAAVAQNRMLAGKAYGMLGPMQAMGERDLERDADFVILGAEAEGYLGDLAIGNVLGDAADELILGARQADPDGNRDANRGAIYVLQVPQLSTVYDLATGTQHRMVSGRDAGDFLSRAAVGNVDGQGLSDLVAGAHNADGPLGDRREDSGEAYLLLGSAAAQATPPATRTRQPVPSDTPTSTATMRPSVTPSTTREATLQPTHTLTAMPTKTATPTRTLTPTPSPTGSRPPTPSVEKVQMPLILRSGIRP